MITTELKTPNPNERWIDSPDASSVEKAFTPGRTRLIDGIQFTRQSSDGESSFRVSVGYDFTSEEKNYFIVRITSPEPNRYQRLFWDPNAEDTLELEIPDSGGGYWEFSPGNRVPYDEAVKLLKRFVSEPDYTGDDLVWRS